MWSLDDLKDMNQHDSGVYKLAMQAGLPDGLARDFKKDLKIFKPQ